MTIKKYGTGGKPEVVDDDRPEQVEVEEEPEDDDRDDEPDPPVAPESRRP